MQHGTVNSYLEPVVALMLHGNGAASEAIDFTIDTGFSGELTLPQNAINRLNLLRDEEGVPYILADGTLRVMPRYIGRAQWHGQIRDVNIIDNGSEALLGMQLLAGSNLNFDAAPGGAVIITELS